MAETSQRLPDVRKCRICGREFVPGKKVPGYLSGAGELCNRDRSREYRESPLVGQRESLVRDANNSTRIIVHCSPELREHLEKRAVGLTLSQWCRDALARASKFVAQKRGSTP